MQRAVIPHRILSKMSCQPSPIKSFLLEFTYNAGLVLGMAGQGTDKNTIIDIFISKAHAATFFHAQMEQLFHYIRIAEAIML